MKRYSILLLSLLSVYSSSLLAKQCIDAHQLSGIGKDLKQYTKQLSCPLNLKSSDINWVMDQELPKLINKQFLGVEPPSDWQNMSKLLILSCYSDGDLCDAKIQKEVGSCLTANGALLLVKYGSWLSDNCEALQNNVVDKWQEKKTVVYQLIDEIFTRIKPPLSN
ncbi:hypothetical protein Lqui_1714 [Legionella quinlivanii]|uniref:Uncharacterized protein n=1 Tax=Legionella quinlivanii TaxID=45073 RepID=A0A0W0Y0Q9_9GAMM|nr:hypothetical protein [Legionella quinlivanii]KTD50389.1 hypothetical protein Lqui_1714 [Legionella quinlivanii]MCW8449860.1 hypothetical protein [Legionella quinlivanii]SEF41551.1 hypothetical protein SAMN02746093_00111 [Legionella quinlivanii DSM 21216]STY11989.1 Uncharacterised protein [Legionella quinlivanii]